MMTEPASIVTVLFALAGETTSLYSGAVKVLACHSFKKKPVVSGTSETAVGGIFAAESFPKVVKLLFFLKLQDASEKNISVEKAKGDNEMVCRMKTDIRHACPKVIKNLF